MGMPWRDSVAGILAMFYGGLETGGAWADIIFGDHLPAGRLPIMIPATEEDTIPITKDKEVNYAEGMRTSYRNKRFRAAFPFGHGLTYTTFEYLPATSGSPGELCMCVPVRNAGAIAAGTVVQLYL